MIYSGKKYLLLCDAKILESSGLVLHNNHCIVTSKANKQNFTHERMYDVNDRQTQKDL